VKLRITYNAPVVLTFAFAAVVAFVLMQTIDSAHTWFMAYPSLSDSHAYVGLFSHILGHESWEHLLGNFMVILLIGPILEERHGSIGLLIMILITALVTGVSNVVLSSHGLMGASGIVFMMILLASMANMRGGEVPLTFIAVALLYLGGELVHVFRNDHISHMAHLVGGAVGAAFGFLGARKKSPAAITAKPRSPSGALTGLDKKVG
jgi:GlpG protein